MLVSFIFCIFGEVEKENSYGDDDSYEDFMFSKFEMFVIFFDSWEESSNQNNKQ